jgi:hypothetical protein
MASNPNFEKQHPYVNPYEVELSSLCNILGPENIVDIRANQLDFSSPMVKTMSKNAQHRYTSFTESNMVTWNEISRANRPEVPLDTSYFLLQPHQVYQPVATKEFQPSINWNPFGSSVVAQWSNNAASPAKLPLFNLHWCYRCHEPCYSQANLKYDTQNLFQILLC